MREGRRKKRRKKERKKRTRNSRRIGLAALLLSHELAFHFSPAHSPFHSRSCCEIERLSHLSSSILPVFSPLPSLCFFFFTILSRFFLMLIFFSFAACGNPRNGERKRRGRVERTRCNSKYEETISPLVLLGDAMPFVSARCAQAEL